MVKLKYTYVLPNEKFYLRLRLEKKILRNNTLRLACVNTNT